MISENDEKSNCQRRVHRRRCAGSEGAIESFTATNSDAPATSNGGVVAFALALFVAGTAVVTGAFYLVLGWYALIVGVAMGLLLAASVRVAQEWERVVVLRLGRFHKVVGPGAFAAVPFIDSVAARIDTRMQTTRFGAEETLTSDLVPVDVDAVLFWCCWEPKKAATEVANYQAAVSWAAQTAMRDVIGRISLKEITTQREELDAELQKRIEEKSEAWGISVVAVEIRDIVLPKDLQDAMSREAQAERERDARIVLAEAERDISEMFASASNVYAENATALQLRTMNLVYESAKDGRAIVIPSSFADALTGLKKAHE
ncbi:MAG: slipin family protein [Adlercreutzia sp.]|nr:slipin family protein [Adlercreutzia sp.]